MTKLLPAIIVAVALSLCGFMPEEVPEAKETPRIEQLQADYRAKLQEKNKLLQENNRILQRLQEKEWELKILEGRILEREMVTE